MKNTPEIIKGTDKQALDMAREALGRVKEMDLTTEQKEKVMAMIDEANTEEKAGNKSKALRILLELSQFLKNTKKAETQAEEVKQKQLDYIDDRIAELPEMYFFESEKYKQNLKTALEIQKEVIASPENERIINLKSGEAMITESETFSEQEIMEMICLLTSTLPQDQWKFYTLRKVLDEKGRLVLLNLGNIGRPEIEYYYMLQGSYSEVGTAEQTFIDKLDTDIETGGKLGSYRLAYYDPAKADWEIVDVS